MKLSSASRVFNPIFASLLGIIWASPAVVAVCPLGYIGVVTVESIGNTNTVELETSVIVDSSCAIIDSRNLANTDIYGSSDAGSTVVYSVGTNTPDSVQTPTGLDWGKCFASFESCATGVDGSQIVSIEYCCAPAPPGSA